MDAVKWLPTLYQVDNNGRWRFFKAGWSDGLYHSITGLLYKKDGSPGKVKPETRKVKANNVSKTALLAAEALAGQEWKDKQRRGRYIIIKKQPKPKDAAKYAQQDTRRWPAVCLEWGKCKEENLTCSTEEPWYGQPKADGERITAWLIQEEIELYSRRCLESKFKNKIRRECKQVIDYINEKWPALGLVGLDGEMYVPGRTLQFSRSVCSRTVNKHPDEHLLVYIIFDIIEYTLPFAQRAKYLAKLAQQFSDLKQLQFFSTAILESEDEIIEYRDQCAIEGYDEGVVLRRSDLLYSTKKEHKHDRMVKFKNYIDNEFKIIGWKEGNTNREGCVYWHMRDLKDKTKTFWCQHKAPVEEQRELFEHASEYKGKLMTVRYLRETDEGLPREPRAIRIRHKDDLPDKDSTSNSSESSKERDEESSE